ncbi:hypothetical protein PENTCL1PPCAC_21043, partial [Pristionchus entomophagus]
FSGIVMLAFNSSIVLLIVFDNDSRNKDYRKYLCCLQVSSMVLDTFSDFYAPVVQYHNGIFYSDSFLSSSICIGNFQVVKILLFGQVIIVYITCVYYRRGMVLDRDRLFNFYGWRRKIAYLVLEVYCLIAISTKIYLMNKSVQTPEVSFLFDLLLPKSHSVTPAFGAGVGEKSVNFYSAPIADSVAVVMIAMIVQLIREVKKGMKGASAATRRYQRLAVKSLILQGAVPSSVYIIPSYANTCLQFAPTILDLGEKFDRFASVLSPILWIIITKHTFLSSLTILYCCPSYRRKIVAAITRS